MRRVEVIVVGAGVMGAATARSLARSSAEVLALERFEVGHRRGSSHGASRIFRFSYPDALYVGMAMESLPLWRELEAESGERLLTTLGGLDVGRPLGDHVSALEAHGARYEVLDDGEASRRFPYLSLSGGPALFQPDAGILAADRAWRQFLRSAESHGAEVRERTRVLEVIPRGETAVVRTTDETFEARCAVVTAGAWARPLLEGAGIDLPVQPSRQTVAYFRVEGPIPLPTLVDWRGSVFYALPSPGQGLKVGEHGVRPQVDPDDGGGIDRGTVSRLAAWVAERYPSADAGPVLAETCLYTSTPDESFVLERHGPIVVGSPCSGHGFKFAPLIGRRLAGLALGTEAAPGGPHLGSSRAP
jgi:monomeric sarcosine oxidase